MTAIESRALSESLELSTRSEDYLLNTRDLDVAPEIDARSFFNLDARDIDDLVELEARTMQRASPGRKSTGGRARKGQGVSRKRASQKQRNRAVSRPQLTPRRKGRPGSKGQGSLRAVRARARVRGGSGRSRPPPRAGQRLANGPVGPRRPRPIGGRVRPLPPIPGRPPMRPLPPIPRPQRPLPTAPQEQQGADSVDLPPTVGLRQPKPVVAWGKPQWLN